MTTIPRNADSGAAADSVPNLAEPAKPAPGNKIPRWFSARGGERARQFAASLKANTRWITQFLHGGI